MVADIKSRIKSKRDYSLCNSTSNKTITNKHFLYFKKLLSRVLISFIIVLISIIYTKYSTENLLMYKKYVLNNTWSFAKLNAFYQKYLGGVLPFDNIVKDNSIPVFNETLNFKSRTEYFDGIALEVGLSYLLPALKSGIIVFLGEKDDYGYTVIVQGSDGVDIWYGNITPTDLKLYDYIEKGSLIGESLTDNIYLVMQKEGHYLTYEEYLE